MSRSDLALILDECVQRLHGGEDPASCLARYPDHAVELKPMLAVAVQLRGLAEARLPSDSRMRAKAALRRTLAERRATAAQVRPWPGWLTGGRLWQGARGLTVAALCIVLIFGALTATTVAASKPGDFSYPLRVAVERAPALFQWAPAGRAATELTVADRRLADLQTHFTTAGRADATALNALLTGDEAAAKMAPQLDPVEREKVISRVVSHADALAGLAQLAAEPEVADTLQAAAEHALTIADRIRSVPPAPGSRPTADASPSPTPTVATNTPSPEVPAGVPPETAMPGPEVEETATPTPTATPTASATATTTPTDTQQPTREPEPTATASPLWPRPTHTLEPRPRLTETPWLRTGTPGLPPRPTRTPPAPWPRPTRTPGQLPVTPVLPPMPGSTPQPLTPVPVTPRPHTITPRVPPIVATLTARATQGSEGTITPRVPHIVVTLTARATQIPEGTITPRVPPVVATLTARATQMPEGTITPRVPPVVATLTARATQTP